MSQRVICLCHAGTNAFKAIVLNSRKWMTSSVGCTEIKGKTMIRKQGVVPTRCAPFKACIIIGSGTWASYLRPVGLPTNPPFRV